jgi:hypothetical protein
VKQHEFAIVPRKPDIGGLKSPPNSVAFSARDNHGMDQALIDDIAVFPLPGCREPLSSLSHMLGAFVFAAMAILLIRRGRGDWVRTTSLVVMAASSVLLLLLSSAYHLTWPGPVRDFLLRADVAGIFLLIAGSMTPVHAILFSGPLTLDRPGSDLDHRRARDTAAHDLPRVRDGRRGRVHLSDCVAGGVW